MRGGGFLVAAFIFGLMAAASQATVAPPSRSPRAAERTAALPPVTGEEMSFMLLKGGEPTAALASPAPRRKPAYSDDEKRRLRRLHMFELEAADSAPSFRAGPRGTVLLNH